jgi:deoxyribose-phosphate aldolase
MEKPEMKILKSQTITYEQLAKVIDHSLLKPDMTEQEVVDGCRLAAKYHTATVCVKPCHVKLAAEILKDSDVKVSSVVGFPHGSSLTAIKVAEAEAAMDNGAVELDMVLNIGQLRSGQAAFVGAEIKAVCDVAHARGVKVKAILENAYLSEDQKILACQLAEAAGADWVKTSTGFAPSGATIEDLRLMRAHVSDNVQVKAAGGIRTLDALLAVIDAGVTRCGATATAAIMDEYERRSKEAILLAASSENKQPDLSGEY